MKIQKDNKLSNFFGVPKEKIILNPGIEFDFNEPWGFILVTFCTVKRSVRYFNFLEDAKNLKWYWEYKGCPARKYPCDKESDAHPIWKVPRKCVVHLQGMNPTVRKDNYIKWIDDTFETFDYDDDDMIYYKKHQSQFFVEKYRLEDEE